MAIERLSKARWGAVVLGWAVALASGVVLNLVLTGAYARATGFVLERTEVSLSVVVVALVSGFGACLAGGWVCARGAKSSGGLHGALVAGVGLVSGLALAAVLSAFGLVFAGGVAMPPSCFGLDGEGIVAGLILFLFNLFGGYLGGLIGEAPTG